MGTELLDCWSRALSVEGSHICSTNTSSNSVATLPIRYKHEHFDRRGDLILFRPLPTSGFKVWVTGTVVAPANHCTKRLTPSVLVYMQSCRRVALSVVWIMCPHALHMSSGVKSLEMTFGDAMKQTTTTQQKLIWGMWLCLNRHCTHKELCVR